ncbi:MAG: hypothetical protein ACI9EF_000473 [Pseudohongiellaceae bacterium]|jgi:hypothetical protein
MTHVCLRNILPVAVVAVTGVVIWVAFDSVLERGSAASMRPKVSARETSAEWVDSLILPPSTATLLIVEPSSSELGAVADQGLVSESKSGGLIARWSGATPPGELLLGLVEYKEVEEHGAALAALAGGEASVQWGPYGNSLAAAGTPRLPQAEGPRERRWNQLPPGMWKVVALAGSEVVPVGALPVAVSAGEPRVVELTLAPAGAVRVRIELPGGELVAAAKLRVVGPLQPGFQLRWADPGELVGVAAWLGETDGQGEFTLPGVRLGSWYGVHAWTSHGVRATGEVVARSASDSAQIIEATPAVEVLVRLKMNRTLEPVAGRQLLLSEARLQRLSGIPTLDANGELGILRASEPTDDRGELSLPCEPGVWLIAGGEGYSIVTAQITAEVIAAGELTMLLEKSAERDVLRVTTADGWPVQGAEVSGHWWYFDESGVKSGAVNELRTNELGEFRVEDLGDLPDDLTGGLRLFAHHEQQGSGGLGINLSDIAPLESLGLRADSPLPSTLPRNIVVRRSGELQLEFDPLGWPEPPPLGRVLRRTAGDIAEAEEKARLLRLTLRFLGTESLRAELSKHHGDKRTIFVGFGDDEGKVTFEDLEPGCYAVEIASESRGILITTAPLWVRSDEATVSWVEAPNQKLFGQVTLDLAAAGVLAEATAANTYVSLDPEKEEHWLEGSPMLQPSVAGTGGAGHRPVSEDGRAVFSGVYPGRYTLSVWLSDSPGNPFKTDLRSTKSFAVRPGDDLVLRALTERP